MAWWFSPALVSFICWASGHKALKIKKLRNLFKLNSIKGKLKQRTTVANYRPATYTKVKAAQYEIQNFQLVAQHKQICCVTSCKFDEKQATKPELVAQSRPALFFSQKLSSTCNKCFCCATNRPKTSNETMLRDTLEVFVSRLSPPLPSCEWLAECLLQFSFALAFSGFWYLISLR